MLQDARQLRRGTKGASGWAQQVRVRLGTFLIFFSLAVTFVVVFVVCELSIRNTEQGLSAIALAGVVGSSSVAVTRSVRNMALCSTSAAQTNASCLASAAEAGALDLNLLVHAHETLLLSDTPSAARWATQPVNVTLLDVSAAGMPAARRTVLLSLRDALSMLTRFAVAVLAPSANATAWPFEAHSLEAGFVLDNGAAAVPLAAQRGAQSMVRQVRDQLERARLTVLLTTLLLCAPALLGCVALMGVVLRRLAVEQSLTFTVFRAMPARLVTRLQHVCAASLADMRAREAQPADAQVAPSPPSTATGTAGPAVAAITSEVASATRDARAVLSGDGDDAGVSAMCAQGSCRANSRTACGLALLGGVVLASCLAALAHTASISSRPHALAALGTLAAHTASAQFWNAELTLRPAAAPAPAALYDVALCEQQRRIARVGIDDVLAASTAHEHVDGVEHHRSVLASAALLLFLAERQALAAAADGIMRLRSVESALRAELADSASRARELNASYRGLFAGLLVAALALLGLVYLAVVRRALRDVAQRVELPRAMLLQLPASAIARLPHVLAYLRTGKLEPVGVLDRALALPNMRRVLVLELDAVSHRVTGFDGWLDWLQVARDELDSAAAVRGAPLSRFFPVFATPQGQRMLDGLAIVKPLHTHAMPHHKPCTLLSTTVHLRSAADRAALARSVVADALPSGVPSHLALFQDSVDGASPLRIRLSVFASSN